MAFCKLTRTISYRKALGWPKLGRGSCMDHWFQISMRLRAAENNVIQGKAPAGHGAGGGGGSLIILVLSRTVSHHHVVWPSEELPENACGL